MREFARTHAGPLASFSLIGLVNTAVYYGVYLMLVAFLPYVVAHLIAWAVSISTSFVLNCRFTYRVAPTWRRYALFPVSNLPNIAFTTFGVVLLVEWLQVGQRIAPLVAGICAIPFSYLLGRYLMHGRPGRDASSGQSLAGPRQAPADH